MNIMCAKNKYTPVEFAIRRDQQRANLFAAPSMQQSSPAGTTGIILDKPQAQLNMHETTPAHAQTLNKQISETRHT